MVNTILVRAPKDLMKELRIELKETDARIIRQLYDTSWINKRNRSLSEIIKMDLNVRKKK